MEEIRECMCKEDINMLRKYNEIIFENENVDELNDFELCRLNIETRIKRQLPEYKILEIDVTYDFEGYYKMYAKVEKK